MVKSFGKQLENFLQILRKGKAMK